jgi:type VI secretion system protein ImpF
MINTANQKIIAPLLSRLIDDEPDKKYERNSHQFIDVNKLHQDIRDNLEMILNTKFCGLIWPDSLSFLNHSVLAYGISDFTSTFVNNKRKQQQMCQNIKETINRFEPRLQAVDVVLLEDDKDNLERVLRFRIEAMINIRPSPVPAVFESCLDTCKQEFDFMRDEL